MLLLLLLFPSHFIYFLKVHFKFKSLFKRYCCYYYYFLLILCSCFRFIAVVFFIFNVLTCEALCTCYFNTNARMLIESIISISLVERHTLVLGVPVTAEDGSGVRGEHSLVSVRSAYVPQLHVSILKRGREWEIILNTELHISHALRLTCKTQTDVHVVYSLRFRV